MEIAFRTAWMISLARSGSFSKAAPDLPDNFSHRASHVDVQDIGPIASIDPGGLTHGLRPGAEDLYGQRAFFRAALQKPLGGLPIAAGDPRR